MVRADHHDSDAFARFVLAHMAESGRGGSPHFALTRGPIREEVRLGLMTRLVKGLDEPLWGRAWILLSDEPRAVVGHIELRGGRVHAEMHRATLGMGILRAFTGKGYGRVLLETAVRWARDEAKLAWIDLGVFSNNIPARKLYQRMDFVEVGLRKDAYRIDAGETIDDVLMALRLR